MIKTEYRINNGNDVANLASLLATIPQDGSILVTVQPDYEKRTDKQRRLQQVWYTMVSVQKTDETKKDVEHYCKLTFGVPILTRDNQEFNSSIAPYLETLDYEAQKNFMRFLPITRLFGVKQNIEYLNEMELHYQEQNIHLPNRDDLYFDAIGYKRTAA